MPIIGTWNKKPTITVIVSTVESVKFCNLTKKIHLCRFFTAKFTKMCRQVEQWVTVRVFVGELSGYPFSSCNVVISVSGLFVPKTFRSLERKFHTGTFVPWNYFVPWNSRSLDLSLPWNFRSRELSLPGTFVPWNFRSLGTFVPWNFRSVELSFRGTFVPWIFRSLGTFVPWNFRSLP